MCGCPSDALCPICLDGRFMQLKGVAATRGERWADDVAAKVPRDRRAEPWPTDSEKALAAARIRVADLARDPKLLAREANRYAAARWASQRTSERKPASRSSTR